MKIFIYILIIPLFVSCFEEKTYLSDEIRQFVTYKENQELTFVSDKDVTNVLRITKIEDNKFSDGIGASKGEILTVHAYLVVDSINEKRHVSVLSELAEYRNKEDQIIFEMVLTGGRMLHRVPFSKIKNRKLLTLKTRFNEYTDVIKLEFEYDLEPQNSEISKFYWSLSNGYVRLIQHGGTTWDLKSIESR